MRMHIEFDDDLVAKEDALAGPQGRSTFVRRAVEDAVEQELRWARLESAAGAIADSGHEWDADPATWSGNSAAAIPAAPGDAVLRLLDSTVLIDYLRGMPAVGRVRALHAAGDVPCTTAINVEEIVRGLGAEEADAARELFAGLDILPIGAGRAGRPAVGVGSSPRAGAILVTGNPKDFPMPELTVEVWPVGMWFVARRRHGGRVPVRRGCEGDRGGRRPRSSGGVLSGAGRGSGRAAPAAEVGNVGQDRCGARHARQAQRARGRLGDEQVIAGHGVASTAPQRSRQGGRGGSAMIQTTGGPWSGSGCRDSGVARERGSARGVRDDAVYLSASPVALFAGPVGLARSPIGHGLGGPPELADMNLDAGTLRIARGVHRVNGSLTELPTKTRRSKRTVPLSGLCVRPSSTPVVSKTAWDRSAAISLCCHYRSVFASYAIVADVPH